MTYKTLIVFFLAASLYPMQRVSTSAQRRVSLAASNKLLKQPLSQTFKDGITGKRFSTSTQQQLIPAKKAPTISPSTLQPLTRRNLLISRSNSTFTPEGKFDHAFSSREKERQKFIDENIKKPDFLNNKSISLGVLAKHYQNPPGVIGNALKKLIDSLKYYFDVTRLQNAAQLIDSL